MAGIARKLDEQERAIMSEGGVNSEEFRKFVSVCARPALVCSLKLTGICVGRIS
jgi:hypothetical protein